MHYSVDFQWQPKQACRLEVPLERFRHVWILQSKGMELECACDDPEILRHLTGKVSPL